MSGDYSRDGFDALRNFAGVFMQQGRPVLDRDWNELVRILERRIRSETVHTIGRAVVPRETPLGFQIQIAGDSLEIGRGTKYLHGLQLDTFGAANFPGSGDDDFPDPVFDRAREGAEGPEGVLDELISPEAGDFLAYERQPYWPVPAPMPEGAGPHLAYVVAWRREVTPLQEPALLEPALGGVDSTTRWQTVWQVRLLANVGAGTTCATPDGDIEGWEALTAPSTARLTTATVDVEEPEDPCLVPPTDGYTGLENQFYRVEIHSVGNDQGEVRFKFSRENASVAAAIEAVSATGDTITVRRIGRDEVLRFNPGDWVEITDDVRELDHRSGQMLRVAVVSEETREIELEGTLDADLVPSGAGGDTLLARHARVIRWDQRGVIRLADETEWSDLDAPGSDGLIPVPPDGSAVLLESGITVSFSTASGPGGYREMDAWSFAARTAGTQIEELREAPPHSVQRHYGKLAVVTFPNSVQDCRIFWPPEFEGGEAERCGCTVCVTPEDHNSGDLIIQAAIDQIGPEGGTVCLQGGTYAVSETLRIEGRTAITLQGQGLGTVIASTAGGSAIVVTGATDVQIERLTLLSRPDREDDVGDPLTAHGITATNTSFLALRRLAVIIPSLGEAARAHGVALEGVAVGAKIEECLVLAPVGVGAPSALEDDVDEGPGFLALAELRLLDNVLFGTRAALRVIGIAINIATVTIARNLFMGSDTGLSVNWFSPPSGATAIEGNTILSNGDAAVIGVSDLRLEGNEISGGPQAGHGVRLVENVAPEAPTDAQVVGNRIGDLAGVGIRVEGRHRALLIKRNLIRRCGAGGITTSPEAVIDHVSIDNNVIEEIAATIDQAEAGAVVLTRTSTVQVVGNAVRDVGINAPDGATIAGIAVQGGGALAIEGNHLARIGPDLPETRAVAILARPPFQQLSVRGNRIEGAGRGRPHSAWMAIEIAGPGVVDDIDSNIGSIAQPQGMAAAVPGIAATELAFAAIGEDTVSLTGRDFFAIAPARAAQILVESNQIMTSGRPVRPLVLIAETASSGVGFNANQCMQEGGGGVLALVLIGAPRINAANNAIRHSSDSLSMLLSIGEQGRAAPLGNITRGAIEVVPVGLGPPFDALNIIAP